MATVDQYYDNEYIGPNDSALARDMDITSNAMKEAGGDFDRDPEGWKVFMSVQAQHVRRQIQIQEHGN